MTLVFSFGSTSTSNWRQPGSLRASRAFSSAIFIQRSTFSGLMRIFTTRTNMGGFLLAAYSTRTLLGLHHLHEELNQELDARARLARDRGELDAAVEALLGLAALLDATVDVGSTMIDERQVDPDLHFLREVQRLLGLGEQAVVAEHADDALVDLRHGDVGVDHLVGKADGDVHARTLADVAPRHGAVQARDLEQLPHDDRLGLALDVHREGLAGLRERARPLVGGFAQQDLAAQAERFDARGDVHLFADHGVRLVALRAERADEDRAGIDADAEKELGQAALLVLGVERVHGELQLERAEHRALLRRLAGRGLAEVRHDRVAHELVDHAFVGEYHVDHRDEAAVQYLEHGLGRVAVRDRHEAAQVGEQDGELAGSEAVLARRRVVRRLAQELRERVFGVRAEPLAGF